MQTDRQIVKKGPQQHCSYLFEIDRSYRAACTKHFQMSWNSKYTYSWEYSVQNTHWSWKNCRATTLYYMKNDILGLSMKKTPSMEKNTSAFLSREFISWAKLPPVEGTRVTVPTGQVRTTALDALCPQHCACGLWPQTFSWEADIKRSSGCKDCWPGRWPCSALILTLPERIWDAFCMDFLCKARSKGRRHTFKFLLFSPLVLSQKPGTSPGHRSRRISGRTEDQVCTLRIFSMCGSWGRLTQGGCWAGCI